MPQSAAVHVAPGPPAWWSPKGNKTDAVSYDPETGFLTIANGRVASLAVQKVYGPPNSEYLVRWRILHGKGASEDLNDEVRGQVVMNENEFSRAFGLIHDPANKLAQISPENREWAQRFGATDGSQGLFIRDRLRLNVPGPGTGSQGDPNISVLLSEESIQFAIQLLLFKI